MYFKLLISIIRVNSMNKIIVILFVFLIASCEEEHIKDWTDDPQYDPKPSSLLKN